MIFRVSQKLNAMIRGGPLTVVPPHEDFLLDWSAQVFTVATRPYVLLSNTESLYSAVLDGTVATNADRFTEVALGAIRDMLDGIGFGDVYSRCVEPAAMPVQWGKAANRSVTGSMNELIVHATGMLVENGRALRAVSDSLNGVLLSILGDTTVKYRTPREVFAQWLTGSETRPAGDCTMSPKRITIIRHIHGKITREGKVSEPDIYWIIEKWLERHPAIKHRIHDLAVFRGVMTLAPQRKTDLIHVTLLNGSDIAGYDPAQDEDLYAYFLADDRGVS